MGSLQYMTGINPEITRLIKITGTTSFPVPRTKASMSLERLTGNCHTMQGIRCPGYPSFPPQGFIVQTQIETREILCNTSL